MIQFCKRCLYGTSHPLGLTLDSNGICSGCRVHEEKDTLDWKYRSQLLNSLVDPYRSTQGNYDCIVPVTGAQDSYFTVWYVKERLGLKPLLVNYNSHWNSKLGIYNLANLRTRSDSDLLQLTINPVSVKRIVKTTLRRFGNIQWHVIAGHTVHPVQTALRKGIPLIIWGGHQGIEQVGMFSHEHEVEMTRHYRKMHDLFGYEADDLLSVSDTLKELDILQLRYPTDHEIQALGLRGIYLGNYVRWDPSEQHRLMAKIWNYRSGSQLRTYDTFDYVDSLTYAFIHDYLKLFKHGFSKVTDQVSREIRFGRISKQSALRIAREFELRPPQYLDVFADWLGTNETSLRWVMDLHRSDQFWEGSHWQGWKFKGWSTLHKDGSINDSEEKDNSELDLSTREFFETDHLQMSDDARYWIVGKGCD